MLSYIIQVSKQRWSEIRGEMGKIDVGILINNVGCSYEHYEYFHSISDETVDNLIEINIRATTEVRDCCMACRLLPVSKHRAVRRSSVSMILHSLSCMVDCR